MATLSFPEVTLGILVWYHSSPYPNISTTPLLNLVYFPIHICEYKPLVLRSYLKHQSHQLNPTYESELVEKIGKLREILPKEPTQSCPYKILMTKLRFPHLIPYVKRVVNPTSIAQLWQKAMSYHTMLPL